MFFHPIPRSMPAIPALMNVPMGQLDAALTGMLGGGAGYPFQRDLLTTSGAKTLSGDTLDVANLSFVTITSETGTADNCKTLVNPVAGTTYILQAAAGHTITIKHGTGNIFLDAAADVVLSGNKQLMLFYSPLGVATDLVIQPLAPALPSQSVTIITPRTLVSSPVANVTLSSIPATYSHLLLILELRTTRVASSDIVNVTFNADATAANYYTQSAAMQATTFAAGELLGTIAGVSCGTSMSGSTGSAGNGRVIMWILNYASTTMRKAVLWSSYVHSSNSSAGIAVAHGGSDWTNTANAIATITFTPNLAGNIDINSAYELYGLN